MYVEFPWHYELFPILSSRYVSSLYLTLCHVKVYKSTERNLILLLKTWWIDGIITSFDLQSPLESLKSVPVTVTACIKRIVKPPCPNERFSSAHVYSADHWNLFHQTVGCINRRETKHTERQEGVGIRGLMWIALGNFMCADRQTKTNQNTRSSEQRTIDDDA